MQRRSNLLTTRKNQTEIEQLFAKANEHLRQGLLEHAKKLLLEIIKKNSNLAIVWDRLGYLYLIKNEVEESISSFHKAIEIDPYLSTSIFNLALIYKSCGNLGSAIYYIEKLHPESSPDVDTLSLAGQIYFAAENFHRAEKLYRQAVEIEPKRINHYINWSMSLNSLGYFDQSIDVCDLALMYEPENPSAIFNKAIAYKNQKKYDEAIACYCRVLEIDPANSRAMNNVGNIYLQLKLYKKAIAFYERCLSISPDDREVLGNLGDAFYCLKEFHMSIKFYSKVLSTGRGDLRVYINCANALQAIHQWENALILYDEALKVDPSNASILCSKGNTLKGLKRWSEARECFKNAKIIDAAYAQADWNLALLELTLGNFTLGYSLYESRWKNPELALVNRVFDKPLWLGEQNIKGSHLFIWKEQGLGDIIQMMRYARMLAEQGVRVTLEVPNELITLAPSLSASVIVVSSGNEPIDFDFHCPYMSLPLACNTTLETIPKYESYLKPSDANIIKWSEKVNFKNDGRMTKVGLVWSGSPSHANDHMRSVSLEKILSYINDENCSYWSLQKEYRSNDYNFLASSKGKVVDFSTDINDFSDTAALTYHMDYVVSVDTSVAHLAAAMGKKVILLLPDDPDYRWLDGRVDSPWYSSISIQKIQQ